VKIEIVMPKMGESLQEGTVTKWLKKVGDKVERDEMILEISTDKVDTEVPSPNSGILVQILVNEGETVEVGTPIAIIETETDIAVDEKPVFQAVVKPVIIKLDFVAEPKAVITVDASVASQAIINGGSLIDVVMPKMGESLQEGTVTKWLKKIGDTVERDEMMFEISTDKVDTEVPSPISGVLAEILVNEGQTVEVGTIVAKVSTERNFQAQSPAEDSTKKILNENIENAAQPQPSISKPVSSGTTDIPTRSEGNFFSPLVRKIAEENSVTLEELLQLKGSGADGRVNKDDLLNYIQTKIKAAIEPISQPAAQVQTPQIVKNAETANPIATPVTIKAPTMALPTGPDVEIIPMDRVRQLISEHMIYSKHTSAHVTSVSEVDVTNIVNYRNKFKDSFEKKEGFKLTYTPFFASAIIDAVKQFPMVNVSVDGKTILRHKRINLGIATALPDGNLIVPVIKNSEILNITGIARSVYDLSTRARTKKLIPDDIQGGTITLTNVGTFGTLFGTPVINQPQSAIFGVGAIKKRAVVKEIEGNDLILVRQMMYVSITYDHRVIDGMLAGQTLAAVVKALENMNGNTITL
jgi:2-oxoglutarate dehydrogenase E2 component (dihydrolipoamide succinyltransferase)